jgi:hypothetical protein
VVVVHVVVDGKSFAAWDYKEHNARQLNYRWACCASPAESYPLEAGRAVSIERAPVF